MRLLKWLALVLFILNSFINCEVDSYSEGIKLYNEGKYDSAIKSFSAIKEEKKTEAEFIEIFALAYMNKGLVLYNKTKNVKVFLGNYQKGLEIIINTPSDDFNRKHSKVLFSLANAFLRAKGRNDIEKTKYYSEAIKHLKNSIVLDSTNTESKQLLAHRKEADFNNLLETAEKQYSKANKTKNISLYFSAMSNLEKAILFNPDHDKIKILKTNLRKKLLGVLDDRAGLAIAVTNTLRKKKALTLRVAVENYLPSNQTINPYQFYLINSRGNEFIPDKKEMGLVDILGQKRFKTVILNQNNSYADGIIVFKIPENTSAHYIVYRHQGKEISRKYFF